MIDIKLLRQNPDFIKDACRKKGVNVDIDKILDLDKKRREIIREIESLRAEQNKISQVFSKKDKISSGILAKDIRAAKELKKKIEKLEPELEKIEQEFNNLILKIPNPPLNDVPVGKDESENVVLREVGKKPVLSAPKDYLEIAEALDWIDIQRAAKVSGTRFGYLKKTAALLEFAIIQFTLKSLIKQGFIPIVPPALIKERAMKAMGYLERGADEIYHLEKDDLYLIGTSEQSIGPMHMDEIFEEKDLPRRYVAFSSCFRREAGSYGKETKGILRVHQFDKIEMFSFCHPNKSREEHQFFLSLEEKLMRSLKIPYRVLQICTGDLGDPAAAKFDIEAWMPGQNTYRETHSTSNCTDFQARRLNIKFKKGKELEYVHTLNGTAFAIGRIVIAIIENYQQKDGSVKIPKVLKEFLIS